MLEVIGYIFQLQLCESSLHEEMNTNRYARDQFSFESNLIFKVNSVLPLRWFRKTHPSDNAKVN
jgi:hypothetical protein